MSGWTGTHISDGTTQSQRVSSALDDGYVQVDEMSWEDIVALCVKFSSHLHFYNLQYQRDGHWGTVFETDDVIIMAAILSMDLKRRERDFLRLMGSRVEQGISSVLDCAQEMNRWLTALKTSRHSSGVALGEKFQEVIQEKLAGPLNELRLILDAPTIGDASGLRIDLDAFDASWGVAGRRRDGGKSPSRNTGSPRSEVKLAVRTFGYALLHALAYFKAITPPFLKESIQDQRHNPAVGLLIAFARLFKRAQDRINTFTQRHRDFYYQKVLKAEPLAYAADRAYLVLEAEPERQGIFIPQGTEFSAGKDEAGMELVYVSDEPILVTDARVQSCATLYFERNPLISPERELHAISHAYVRQIPAEPPDRDRATAQAWPLFGAGNHGVEWSPVEHAEFGFGIASMIFLLKEGQRTVTVGLNIAEPADRDAGAAFARRTYEESSGSAQEFLCQAFHRFLEMYPALLPEKERKDMEQVARHMAECVPSQDIPRIIDPEQSYALFNGFLMELMKRAVTEEQFSRVFGKILSREVVSCQGWLTPEYKALILAQANRLLSPVSLEQVQHLLHHDHANLLSRLLSNLFLLQVTTETGWLAVPSYALLPLQDTPGEDRSGLTLVMTFGPEADPIVPYSEDLHGGGWQTDLPLLVCRINPQNQVYPYSLFEGLIFGDIQIDATVKGATDLLVYNNEGPLDTTKPFPIFGALPSTNSYCLIGSHELAQKTLTSLQIHIEWGDLPQSPGGFREYYRGYATSFSNERFGVDISILQNGVWLPTQESAPCRQRLFETESAGGRVRNTRTIRVPHVHDCRTISPHVSPEEFRYSLQTRNGFLKLQLSEPEAMFGHKEYPNILAAVLTENAKKKHPIPIPNPPYTPLVNRLTFDYTARSVIQLGTDSSPGKASLQDVVIPVHPFGKERPFPAGPGQLPFVFPQYAYDGNLYIGIAARRLQGIITLFFHLQPDSTQTVVNDELDIAWFYLASNRWRRLEPSRLLSDTTERFLSSGIVTLDVPESINRNNTIMPNDLYWLRVSANTHLPAFCSCYGIYTHGLKVLWANRGNGWAHLTHRLPAGRIQQPMVSIPGLRKVTQMGESFGGALPETTREMYTRLSERLRHKDRVSTPWDYERVILARYPEIIKVKCFPNTKINSLEFHPGHVLLVVVPQSKDRKGTQQLGSMANAVLLKHIQSTVQELSAPFTTIDVRNPTYEWIQVRCTIVLRREAHTGLTVNRVNQAIVDFLSPWNKGGYTVRFGWRITREDIETMIRDLPDVEFVTKFSMLHIIQDEQGKYCLEDTARMATEGSGVAPALTPAYPWSLALPMQEHFIETTHVMKSIGPEATGIDEIEIGRTFIIA